MFTRSRRLVLIVCLLAIVLPFFFIGGPTLQSTPLFRALWDFGHILFFAGWVYAIQLKIDVSRWTTAVTLTLLVVVIGGAIEVIQAHTGRDGNWIDLLRDLTGAWLGLVWLQRSSVKIWIARVLVFLLMVPTLWKIIDAARAQYTAQKHFPILADFERAVELHGIKGQVQRSAQVHSRGNYALKVRLSTALYSGVTFNNFYNSWQGYNNLLLDMYNPGEQPIDVMIRIDDLQHQKGDNHEADRFNRLHKLVPGWNSVRISINDIQQAPATRPLQLDQIHSMIIFAVKLPAAQDLYVDNIRLE